MPCNSHDSQWGCAGHHRKDSKRLLLSMLTSLCCVCSHPTPGSAALAGKFIDLAYYSSVKGLGYMPLLQPKAVSHRKSLLSVVWYQDPKEAFVFCGIGCKKISPRDLYFFNFSFLLGKQTVGIISFLYKCKLGHIYSGSGFWGFRDQVFFFPF